MHLVQRDSNHTTRLVRADTLFRDFTARIRSLDALSRLPTSSEEIICDALADIVERRDDEVSANLRRLLVDKCQIMKHVERLRSVYFMEDGAAMDGFARMLFKGVRDSYGEMLCATPSTSYDTLDGPPRHPLGRWRAQCRSHRCVFRLVARCTELDIRDIWWATFPGGRGPGFRGGIPPRAHLLQGRHVELAF